MSGMKHYSEWMTVSLVSGSAWYNLRLSIAVVYLTNSKPSKIYSIVTDTCRRCHMSPANMTHTFWSCPPLQGYWTTVFKHLAEVLNMVLTPCADIFGILPGHQIIRRKTKDSTAFASLLVCRRILLPWKSPFASKASLWLKDLTMFLNPENIGGGVEGVICKIYPLFPLH